MSSTPTLQGIDISSWQQRTPDLRGLAFVFVRASYGLHPDTRYLQHATAVRSGGLVLGAYHFGMHGDPGGQVDTFLRSGVGARMFALDLEAAGANSMTLDEAAAFIRGMHARGHKCGLYHSRSGFPNVGQDWNWIADWTPAPTPYGATFRQTRGSPLDLDVFYGTQQELEAFAMTQDYTPPTVGKPATPEPSYTPPTAGKGPEPATTEQVSTVWGALRKLAETIGYGLGPTPGWTVPTAPGVAIADTGSHPWAVPAATVPGFGTSTAAAPVVTFSAPSGPATPAEPATLAEAAAQVAEYIVKEGDTLWSLAGELLGDTTRWPDLLNANRDTLSDPAELAPGMPLRVPRLA